MSEQLEFSFIELMAGKWQVHLRTERGNTSFPCEVLEDLGLKLKIKLIGTYHNWPIDTTYIVDRRKVTPI